MIIPIKRQEEIMRLMIRKGYEAAARGDSPFAAALVDYKGEIAATTTNGAFTEHSVNTVEMNILRIMSEQHGMRDLSNFVLFTNAEPYAGGMIYMLRAGIRHFYYGAPIETDAYFQPLIKEIMQHLPEKVYLHGGILEEECIEQVKRGRYIQRGVLLRA